jgi:dienelactone hydrolase
MTVCWCSNSRRDGCQVDEFPYFITAILHLAFFCSKIEELPPAIAIYRKKDLSMTSAVRSGPILFGGILYLLATSTPAAAAPMVPPNSVMKYLGMRANCQAALLPPVPDDRAKWESRRAVVRRELAQVLGLPAREPMRAKVLATHAEEGVVIEDVMYLWAEHAYVFARVVRPAAARGPLPALVEPPGWLGTLKYGGASGPYQPFAFHMVKKGYLLIFIDDPHLDKRVAPCAGLYGAAAAAGTQLMGIQVFDTLRGLDYLLTRTDVDPGRIGVAGLCQGSEQTWLAAALDERFKIAVPVCGTTTYEAWARMATGGRALSDPSPYVADVLLHTDLPEIDACIAPRPIYIASNSGDDWWPRDGYNKVLATLQRTFAMYGQSQALQHVRDLRSHSMTPFIAEIGPWIDEHLGALPACGTVSPQPCGEPIDADFSMLRYMQRRIAKQTDGMAGVLSSLPSWQTHRQHLAQWLAEACRVAEMRRSAAVPVSRRSEGKLGVETLLLPQDEDLSVPATVYTGTAPAGGSRPAVILSHDGRLSMSDPAVVKIAKALAEDGYVVCLPEHASPRADSHRPIDNINSFYGIGDMVALPPMAMRVWDDLRAVQYLTDRGDIDRRRIALVGMGAGGVDAAITAVLDRRVAALAVVGATTLGDWTRQVAPQMEVFDRIYPLVPHMAEQTDLPYIYSAVAPRPLLLLESPDRAEWPPAGQRRVQKTAATVYRLQNVSPALQVAQSNSRGAIQEIRAWLKADMSTPAK